MTAGATMATCKEGYRTLVVGGSNAPDALFDPRGYCVRRRWHISGQTDVPLTTQFQQLSEKHEQWPAYTGLERAVGT